MRICWPPPHHCLLPSGRVDLMSFHFMVKVDYGDRKRSNSKQTSIAEMQNMCIVGSQNMHIAEMTKYFQIGAALVFLSGALVIPS